MACSECNGCLPIRLNPAEFSPNRNQKRTWKKNADIEIKIQQLEFRENTLALLGKFISSRYPDSQSSPVDYYAGFFLNCITDTYEFQYWAGGKLIGVSIVDISGNSMNIVYFFFDPEEKKRSPGTFNILNLIHFCRNRKIERVYLGYLIKQVKSMNYKDKFKPHYLFKNDEWVYYSKL